MITTNESALCEILPSFNRLQDDHRLCTANEGVVIRHFEQEKIAKRYAKYRPRVQAEIIATIAKELGWSENFETAVDFACGTGHSTEPLLNYADRVIGCDISAEMLEQAKQAYPSTEFRQIKDGILPFEDASVNVLTVGFAFHWLDQPAFLSEAARVLDKDGVLVVYNMFFPGNMEGNERYHDWHQNTYITKFATPKRNSKPLREVLGEDDYGLLLEKGIPLSIPQEMSALALRNYLTTQSNVSVAVENGDSLSDIDDWLDKSIAPYFSRSTAIFEYKGQAGILRRT